MNATSKARQLRDAIRHFVVAYGALEETKRPCGAELSAPHAYALLELLEHGEVMTVAELAKRLAIDRTNVSRLCLRMEKAGQIRRESHPEDGRARALCLTAKGKRLALSVDQQSTGHFLEVAARLEESLSVAEATALLSELSQAFERPVEK